ncbi:MAG: hypothetical protein JNJ41_13085 [Bacteroidia bacterium]|nr:hypothetical protein [Bacteroidia bacterium]
MQEQKTWNMLIKHLSQEDSNAEKELFSKWIEKDEKNKVLFDKVKALWNDENNSGGSLNPTAAPTFFGRFTKEKMKGFLFNQTIGNLVGFVIGMWVTTMFSHHVLERRGLKNLFGLTGRKKVAVNEIPEWLQSGIAILVGFITLELINHFFQTKKHLIVWDYIKRSFIGMKGGNKNS